MELKEFIKTVLVHICEAVDEAKTEIKESAIAPATIDGIRVEEGQFVSFEISVTVSDSIKGEGEGKIQVLSLGAAAGGEISSETQNINKISFQIPVYYSAKFNKK